MWLSAYIFHSRFHLRRMYFLSVKILWDENTTKVWRVLYSLIVWLLYTGNFSVAVSPLSWSGARSKWRSCPLPKRSHLNIFILTCFHCFNIQWSFSIFHLPGVGTEDGTVAMKPLADGLVEMFYTIWWNVQSFLVKIYLPILRRFKIVHFFL